jgi:hypothetical protein
MKDCQHTKMLTQMFAQSSNAKLTLSQQEVQKWHLENPEGYMPGFAPNTLHHVDTKIQTQNMLSPHLFWPFNCQAKYTFMLLQQSTAY